MSASITRRWSLTSFQKKTPAGPSRKKKPPTEEKRGKGKVARKKEGRLSTPPKTRKRSLSKTKKKHEWTAGEGLGKKVHQKGGYGKGEEGKWRFRQKHLFIPLRKSGENYLQRGKKRGEVVSERYMEWLPRKRALFLSTAVNSSYLYSPGGRCGELVGGKGEFQRGKLKEGREGAVRRTSEGKKGRRVNRFFAGGKKGGVIIYGKKIHRGDSEGRKGKGALLKEDQKGKSPPFLKRPPPKEPARKRSYRRSGKKGMGLRRQRKKRPGLA